MTRYANQQAYEQATSVYPQSSSPYGTSPQPKMPRRSPGIPPQAQPDWMAGLQRDPGYGGNPATMNPKPRTGGPMKPKPVPAFDMPFLQNIPMSGFGYGYPNQAPSMPRRAPKAPQSGGYLDYDTPRSSYGGYGGAYGHNPGDQWGGLYR